MRKIALPIEVKVRELDGKLWLASHLANQGFRVAIGQLGSINDGMDLIRPDIYLGVNALYGRRKEQLYRRLGRSNVKILILDTEGGVFEPTAYARRLSMAILEHVERYLAWGNVAADVLCESQPGFPPDKIAVTGNPRIDLVQNQFRQYYAIASSQLEDEYGEYILVNTNFGTANHFSEDIDRKIYQRLRRPPLVTEYVDYQRKLLKYFVEGVICLSNQFPDLTIIVRPHPSENHATYKGLLASYRNVHVEHRGAVRPWILGAMAVIHNGCTTGIEGVLLGKPVFAFQPLANEQYDQSLPNMVSQSVDSADGLCKEISALLGGAKYGDLSSAQEKELQQFIYNTRNDVISANLISDVIGGLDGVGARQTMGLLGLRPRARARRAIKSVLGPRGIKIARRILGRTEGALYGRQKFPGLNEAELRARVDKLRACGVEVEDLRIEPIKSVDNAFWIYKE